MKTKTLKLAMTLLVPAAWLGLAGCKTPPANPLATQDCPSLAGGRMVIQTSREKAVVTSLAANKSELALRCSVGTTTRCKVAPQVENFSQVQVGEKVNPRQQVIVIPDLTTLVVQTKVSEACYSQVHPGQKAFVKLDAMPDKPLTGTVLKVAPMPDRQNPWLNPNVKFFVVSVKLDEQPQGLKPNMNAQVELELARMSSVVQVPIAAVFTEQEQTYCYRVDGALVCRAPIKIGRMNKERVEVLTGLDAGQTVMLAPPEGGEGGNDANNMPMTPGAKEAAKR